MCLVRCSPRHTYLVDLEKGLALAVHDPHNGDVVAEPACVVREDGHADFVHLDSRNVPAHLEDVVEVHDLDEITKHELEPALNQSYGLGVARAQRDRRRLEVFTGVQRPHLDQRLVRCRLVHGPREDAETMTHQAGLAALKSLDDDGVVVDGVHRPAVPQATDPNTEEHRQHVSRWSWAGHDPRTHTHIMSLYTSKPSASAGEAG